MFCARNAQCWIWNSALSIHLRIKYGLPFQPIFFQPLILLCPLIYSLMFSFSILLIPIPRYSSRSIARKIKEVKKLPVKFFLLSHQGTRWPWGMFVQRFRANASCVLQGKIQDGLFHFLTKQEAFIWNEWNNSTAHVVKCATNKEQRKYGLTERRFTKIFRFFHALEKSRKLRDKFGKWS